MLITSEQVDELLATLADLSGMDPELTKHSAGLIHQGQYDEAVSRAFVVLEERLRKVLRVHGGTGADLSQKAFAPKSGELVERLPGGESEADGIRDTFVGAFKAFRNPAMHTVTGYSLDEARDIVRLVNLLLFKLEQVRQPVQVWMPPEVASALPADSRARLIGFVRKLQTIGIGRGEGKQAIPYHATLPYKPPSWDQPRPSPVTIFYVGMSKGQPVLAFNSRQLSRVTGLNIGSLEKSLLELGCTRRALKEIPIRLSLLEHSDDDTFDRLYGILRDLIDKYR